MMLKYMHDHYLDKYEWFMRADDDVYIKGDKLEHFLRSLNSSEPLFLGQTGLGTTEEMGKLALEPGENFCMGGARSDHEPGGAAEDGAPHWRVPAGDVHHARGRGSGEMRAEVRGGAVCLVLRGKDEGVGNGEVSFVGDRGEGCCCT